MRETDSANGEVEIMLPLDLTEGVKEVLVRDPTSGTLLERGFIRIDNRQ